MSWYVDILKYAIFLILFVVGGIKAIEAIKRIMKKHKKQDDTLDLSYDKI